MVTRSKPRAIWWECNGQTKPKPPLALGVHVVSSDIAYGGVSGFAPLFMYGLLLLVPLHDLFLCTAHSDISGRIDLTV